jgi:branched-chain amino acid transport system substrate-binding protein
MRKSRFFVKAGIVITVVLMGFLGLTLSAASAKTLKVGSVWSLTGPGSEINLIMQRGETLCKDWINARGGVNINGEKYQIEIVTADIKSTAEGCVTAANKLVLQDKVKFVLGLTTPFQVDAVASVTEPNKVAYFASIFNVMTSKNKFSVSSYFPYAAPKVPLYDYLQKAYPNVKKIASTQIQEPAVQRAAEVALAEMKKRGLTFVGAVTYPFGAQDYYPIINKALTYKPDAIDMNMEFPEGAALLLKTARELGFSGPIIGGSPWDPIFIRDRVGKDYATDFFLPTFEPVSAGDRLPAITKTIVKLWTDTYKVPFVVDSLRGWDPLYLLVQSIEAAKSLQPENVIKAFEKMKSIDTSVGPAKIGGLKTYGVNHVVLPPCPVSRLKNGQVEFVGFSPVELP